MHPDDGMASILTGKHSGLWDTLQSLLARVPSHTVNSDGVRGSPNPLISAEYQRAHLKLCILHFGEPRFQGQRMLMMFSKQNHRYSQLESRKGLKTALSSRLSLRNIFTGFLVILCVAGASFFAGRSSVRDQSLLTIPREFSRSIEAYYE